MGQTVWDSSAILSEKSIFGRVLHTLVGYSDQPTLLQLITYLVTLLVIYILTRSVSPPVKTQTARG